MRDILFGAGDSIDRYYRECSFGNLSFSGDVVGPYTIPHPNDGSDGYTPAGWAWAAEKMAAAAGVNLSLYTQKVYVLAPTTAYWAGTAFLGGNQAWVNGGYWSDKGVYAHEIGHCLGMYHASTPSAEYGDGSDVMGYGLTTLPHTNAPHKIQMGWLPDTRVQTITQSGSYSISLLETAGSAAQALKIAIPNSHLFYYLSYRRRVGFDATFAHVTVSYFVPNQRPVIVSLPWATPNPVTLPSTTTVAVAANDPDNGPAPLAYSWSVASGPGTVSFSPNGTTGSAYSTASRKCHLSNQRTSLG